MNLRSRQQLGRDLEPLKQALEAYRRSLEGLESALMEFEETLGHPEPSPGRCHVQQRSSSSE